MKTTMAIKAPVTLLCCGSFNPITNMHLRMFELARDALQKTATCKVTSGIISPVGDKYDKEGLAECKHRVAMINHALKSNKWIRLDTWESVQDEWVPTLMALKHHKKELESSHNANIASSNTSEAPSKRRRVDHNGSGTDSTDYGLPRSQSSGSSELDNRQVMPKLKLLCGADLLESFAVPGLWKEEHIESIVRDFGLVCISRAGSDPEKFIYESDVLTKYKNNIILITEWIHNDISATKIRRALRRGESVKYLLQEGVIEYIVENQLYGAGDK